MEAYVGAISLIKKIIKKSLILFECNKKDFPKDWKMA